MRAGPGLTRTTLLVWALLGCAGEDLPESGSTPSVPRWQATPDLRIGRVDDALYALTAIGDMTVDDEGRIYTLHPREARVRVFGPDGTALYDIGRRGEGPGEFTSVDRMGWVADTLWVLDVRSGYRFLEFTRAGEFIEAFRVPYGFPGVPGQAGPPRARGRLADGTVHGAPVAWTQLVAMGEITEHVPVLMARDGTITDTLPAIPFGHAYWGIFDPDDPWRNDREWFGPQPFADGPLWSFVRGERALLRLDRTAASEAGAAAFTLTKLSFSGDTLFTRSYRYEPVPVPPSTFDSILAARVSELAEGEMRGVPEGRIRDWAERTLYAPSFEPPVEAMRTGRDGTTWLRRPARDGPATWLVLDPAGEPLSEVQLPASLHLMESDRGHVWGWETDDLDVPYVLRYRIEAGTESNADAGRSARPRATSK